MIEKIGQMATAFLANRRAVHEIQLGVPVSKRPPRGFSGVTQEQIIGCRKLAHQRRENADCAS
jgi:hypothetical protein